MTGVTVQAHEFVESVRPAGYARLVAHYNLQAPLRRATGVSLGSVRGNRRTEELLTIHDKRDWPGEDDPAHLDFAMKYEHLDLLLLKKAFDAVDPMQLADYIRRHPHAMSARRLWFLYEWLTGRELSITDLATGNYIEALDSEVYYGLRDGAPSRRHRIRDNIPGTPQFTAIARRPAPMDKAEELASAAKTLVDKTNPETLRRAAAFMLLSDSKSSFAIEGETPPRDRLQRWGRALAQAGRQPLDLDSLNRLQKEVLGDGAFVELGLRKEGVFLGTRDRSNDPRPEFIGARPQDLKSLVDGLLEYDRRVTKDPSFNPLVHAAGLSFGFVYIHPYQDGNGRLHRYLINHVLTERKFSPSGIVLPISSEILRRITDYASLLRSRSGPLLPFIPWKANPKGNVEVTADTSDLYRFINVSDESTFLSECVSNTLEHTFPAEISYIEAFDRALRKIGSVVEMPNNLIGNLIVQAVNNGGKVPNKRRKSEYKALTDDQVAAIETLLQDEFEIQAAGTEHGPFP
jgi:hypothetical protein